MRRGFLNVEWEKGVVLVWYYWHCFGFFLFFIFNPSANCQLVNERVKRGKKNIYVGQFEKKEYMIFFY